MLWKRGKVGVEVMEEHKEKAEKVRKNEKRIRCFDFSSKIKEDQAMMLDLLNIITYMSSIATADIGRDKIIELASQQEGITAVYLRRVHLLVRNYGYDYAEACKVVAETASHPALKDFLIRLSNAFSTGEDEEKFLRTEAEHMVEKYTNKYSSDVESLRKWTDGYSALLVSVTTVIAVFLTSSMFQMFKIGNLQFLATLGGIILCFVAFFGVYIIYRVAPYEKVVHSLDVKSKEQELLKRMSIFLIPFALIFPIILLISGADEWIIFLTISILLAPMGFFAMKDARNIERRDRDLSPFLKSLGATAGITGTTLAVAISRLDKKAVGSLEEFVNRLYKRLVNGINPSVCWYYFMGETGSELVNKYVRVFLDAINLGGDPIEIGKVTSHSVLGITLLRARRKLVANGFINLMIPLHVGMCGVLMFIYEIVLHFNKWLEGIFKKVSPEVIGGIPSGFGYNISGVDISFISKYVMFVIFVLTIANSFASKCASGGSNYKLCAYASVLFALSALIYLAMPPLVSKIFTMPFLSSATP